MCLAGQGFSVRKLSHNFLLTANSVNNQLTYKDQVLEDGIVLHFYSEELVITKKSKRNRSDTWHIFTGRTADCHCLVEADVLEDLRKWHKQYKYEGCSKWIAYFYLETSNFKLAPKYSFHALEVLPVARNAKFQPMYPLLEGVTVRWFGHSNKVLMNGRSKCLSGLVFPPSKECFQFRKQKEITWGKV